MGNTKKSTMKNESKMGEQEAGASRNNKKVSSEDDTNTNDAPLNSTGSPTTDSADDSNDACECRTEECTALCFL